MSNDDESTFDSDESVFDRREEKQAAHEKARREFEEQEFDEHGRPVDFLDRDARQERIEEAGGREEYLQSLFPDAMTEEEIEEWREESEGERVPLEQSELGEGEALLEMDEHIFALLNGDITKDEFEQLTEETDPRAVEQVTVTPDEEEQ